MEQETREIIKKIHEIFIKKGITLSVAESCTGGLISDYLTDIPGASRFFTAGIISYSEDAKRSIVEVSEKTILKKGIISKETAEEMAGNMLRISKTDFSVASTGNLGPDVLEGKENGLVFIAASTEGRTACRELRLKGDRRKNKEEAALSALRLLIDFVEGEQV